MFAKQRSSHAPSRYVALHEEHARVGKNMSQTCQIAGVSQRVEYDDSRLLLRHEPMMNEVGADEACTAGNEKSMH